MISSIGTLLIIVVILILLEGFFSGSEIAIISANKTLLKQRYGEQSRVANVITSFLKEPQWLIGTHLLGTNLCVVASSTLVTFYMHKKYGELGELYTVLLLSPTLLLLGEMVPKIYFQEYADRVAGKSLLGLWLFSYLFYPAVWVLAQLGEWASRILGGSKGESEPFLARSELKYLLISARQRKNLPAHEQRMIRRIFKFSETSVGEVMIPLVEIRALEEQDTVERALTLANRHPYSRYPVYRKRIDNIIGLVKLTDLLASADPVKKVSELIQAVNFVPETMPADQLLAKMQRENFQTAVVVDEYGGCVGIVTREDILEEIIGEIEDEHAREQASFRQIAPDKWLINARMEIDRINEIFGWNLPKEDYETLAGFLLNLFQRIPRAGELIRFKNLIFLVKRASPRVILEVMVTREEDETKPPE